METKLKRLHKGQRVRIANPVHLAARFYKPDIGALIGAGGQPVNRELLDGVAFVFDLAPRQNAQRGLIVFGSNDLERA